MIWVRGGPTDRPRRGIVIVIDKIEVFIMERARAQLLELGFDHDTVERALRHADVAGNGRFDTSVESLVDWLLADQHSRETGQPRSDPKSRVPRPPGDLGGLDGVFEREKEQLDEFATLVQDGLNSVEALVLLSNEIETCARRMVERKRLNVETEDDILEDFLHGSNLAHVVDVADEGVGSAPRLTKKTSAPRARHATYAATDAINAINVINATMTEPCTRARQVGHVLVRHMRSSHGVLSLSEAYRIYNRSRVGNVATPDEFVRACAMFEAAGVPMSLERGALFCCDDSTDEILDKVVAAVSEATTGASRVDVSARMRLPVGVTALYLTRAESRALVARDDTARGVYYHANRFMSF